RFLQRDAAAARAWGGVARPAGAGAARRADLSSRPGRAPRRPGDHPAAQGARDGGLSQLASAQRGGTGLRPPRRRRSRPGDRDRHHGADSWSGRGRSRPGHRADAGNPAWPARLWKSRGRRRVADLSRPRTRARSGAGGRHRPPGRPGLCRRAPPRDARGPVPAAPEGAGRLMRVLTIARLTILEASRRKLLIALGVLTLAVVVLTSWGFSRLPTMKDVTPAEVRLASSQLTILVAFMFSGVLALGSTLVAAPSIASDIESGIALAILPRPIRRSQLLMGKWLGLALLVTLYAVGSGLLELLGIWLATGYTQQSP